MGASGWVLKLVSPKSEKERGGGGGDERRRLTSYGFATSGFLFLAGPVAGFSAFLYRIDFCRGGRGQPRV